MRVRHSRVALFLTSIGLLGLVSRAGAATTNWTGATDNTWVGANWDNGVPGSGDTAGFNGAGNGNTSVTLGGIAQPINIINFTSTPAPYTLGVLSSGDQFNITAAGGITEDATVVNQQAINAALNTLGAATITNSTTASTGTLTINGATTLGGALTLTAPSSGSVTVFNGAIGGTGSLSVSSTTTGTVRLNTANNYSGGTTLTGPAAQIQIGADSTGPVGTPTSGAFGTGTILFNSATPSILEAIGADRTVGNALSLTNGFFVQAASSGAHSLTLTSSFTLGKVVTNNLAAGVALNLGTPGTTSTMAPGGGTIQAQPATSGATGGVTVINDQMTGTGTLAIKQGGTVYINNLSNTNTGNVNVTGISTGSVAVLGAGGTVAGTGKISNGGTVTISATAAGNTQGGMISPADTATAGTISTGGAMAWDPVGRYIFNYNGNDSTAGSTTPGINDFVSITGNLNLANLSSSAKFDLDLVPIGATASSTPLTYTIATVGGTISGGAANAILTNDFSYSGSYDSSVVPTVVVDATGKSLLLTFQPVATPEPGCIALLGLAGMGVLRRRRR